MKELILDILRQLFGLIKPRSGSIVLSKHAYEKVKEYKINPDELDDAFRYGENKTETMIIRKYQNYQIGMYIKPIYGLKKKDVFLIITCWKQENW